jgi:hypothetical protein
MNDAERIADVRRFLLGELTDARAEQLAFGLVDEPGVLSILAEAAAGPTTEGGYQRSPRVATHALSRLPGLAPMHSQNLAMAATSTDEVANSRVLGETFSGDGLETVVLIENGEIVVFLTEESKAPVKNATVTLRLVGFGGRSERRARGLTDAKGRLSLGRAEFFPRPDAPGFYQLSVIAPPKNASV